MPAGGYYDALALDFSVPAGASLNDRAIVRFKMPLDEFWVIRDLYITMNTGYKFKNESIQLPVYARQIDLSGLNQWRQLSGGYTGNIFYDSSENTTSVTFTPESSGWAEDRILPPGCPFILALYVGTGGWAAQCDIRWQLMVERYKNLATAKDLTVAQQLARLESVHSGIRSQS